MPKLKNQGPCSVVGCGKPIDVKFMCQRHYHRVWRGAPKEDRRGDKRRHPLYSIWFERKQRGSLCHEWAADLFAMAEVVGERPSPTHLLRKRIPTEPYGPENWEWTAALKREPGESKKSFEARKWASRRERDPDYEGRRFRMRRYGLSDDRYRQMRQEQRDLCAICGKPETAHDSKTRAPKALAVDHCHTTGKVRGLLCWRCNVVIGKVEEDPDLLRAMIAYVVKWA